MTDQDCAAEQQKSLEWIEARLAKNGITLDNQNIDQVADAVETIAAGIMESVTEVDNDPELMRAMAVYLDSVNKLLEEVQDPAVREDWHRLNRAIGRFQSDGYLEVMYEDGIEELEAYDQGYLFMAIKDMMEIEHGVSELANNRVEEVLDDINEGMSSVANYILGNEPGC